MATDPVCGMTVDEKTAAAQADYQGKTYYFCSSDCKTKFQQDPTRYVTHTAAQSR
jgi:Cu+-exporting ATPase